MFHLWLAAHIPPSEDELYYWNWAQHLQWSYYDHPLAVAYLIRLSTSIFGNGIFAIRFFACIMSTAVFFGLGYLTQRKQILGYLVLTPIFFLGSILMTPDIPLIFFWTCYVIWLVHVNRAFTAWEGDPVSRVYRSSPISLFQWAIGGALLGLGCLGKYSMVLAIPCTFLVLASRYRLKAWLGGFLFHLLVAFVFCLPILVYNIQNDFVSFRFQWTHAMAGWDFSFYRFLLFLSSQVLLLGALPFFLLPWCLVKGRELRQDYRLQVCFYFFVFPLLFFLFQALKGKSEANWPLVAYISFWPLAQYLVDDSSFKRFKTAGRALLGLAFATPVLCTALILLHAWVPFKMLSVHRDRLAKLKAQSELSERIAADVAAMPGHPPFFAASYQWTSYFRYRGLQTDQLYPEGRQSNFTAVKPREVCRENSALVFQSAWQPPPLLKCFPHLDIVGNYPVMIRGQESGRYLLVKYTR